MIGMRDNGSGAPRVSRGTVDVGDRTVGYRRAGAGPAVVLVGSLGHSSAPDVPLIAALAVHFTAIAVDPPGFGFSDPLPDGADDAAAIAVALGDTLTAVGVATAALVARHTGGAVALAATLAEPQRFPLLVLDDVPLLDAATRAEWSTESRTVDACDDGSHLLTLWYRRRRSLVHAPWFDTSTTLDIDLTAPETLDLAVHAAVLDALDAGDRHALGDRAALAYDVIDALAHTTVEVVVPTPSHPNLGEPAARRHIETFFCTAEPADRRAGVLAALQSWTGDAPALTEVRDPVRGRWTRQLPDTPWGQIAVRRHRPPVDAVGSVPLVLLHASPLSGESLLPLACELARTREVVVLDTLGNGDSDAPDGERNPEFAAPEIVDFARVALAAITALGIDRFDIFGTHTGAMIGLEMGIIAPDRIRALVLDGLPLLDLDGPNAALPEDFYIDLTPQWDGTHLMRAWSNVVDVLTWYPWNRRDPEHRRPLTQPPTQALHRRVVQMLKSGTSYPAPHRAVLRHPTTSRLPLLTVPTAFCRAPADPMAVYVDRCVAGVASSEVLELQADHAADAGLITRWIEHVATIDQGVRS